MRQEPGAYFLETTMRRRLICYAIAAAFLGSAGCATVPSLYPAPDARTLPSQARSALGEAAGVQAIATAGTWNGEPRDLDWRLTPIELALRNNSAQRIRLSYPQITLTTSSGFTVTALPPYQITGTATEMSTRPVLVPRFSYSRFALAPYHRAYYPQLGPWDDRWPMDPMYYEASYPHWQIPLPTTDMLERALPEGVLEPNGQVSGFVYFPRLPPDVTSATLRIALQDADTGATLGTIEIPFVAASSQQDRPSR
jgi:hypothetical protein